MKSKFIIFSKLSLLLVVIGFFLPIFKALVVSVNGVQLSKLYSELGMTVYSIVVWLIPVLALVSVAITFCLSRANSDLDKPLFRVIDFAILIILILCVFVPLAKNNAFSVLSVGGYLMLLGLAASLALSIWHQVVARKSDGN